MLSTVCIVGALGLVALLASGAVRARRRRAKIAALVPPGRAMGFFEHAFDCMHHIGAFVILQVVRLDGVLSDATLRRALDALQPMHPLLCVHVAGPGGIFEAEGTERIPLHTVPRADAEHWRTVALDELHRPIPYGSHPLLRAVWIGGADAGELLLVSNHAILDGASAAVVVRDLLELCARIDAGTPIATPPPPAHGVPAVDDRLPPLAHGPKPKGPLPKLLKVDATAPAAARRSRVEYLVVDAEAARRLTERSRQAEATVNAAVCAAALLAVRAVFDADRGLSLQSQVGVRGALLPPVPDDMLGCFISGVTTTHDATQATQFWDLARAVRSSISAALDRGDHLTILKGNFGAVHDFGLRYLGPRFNAGRTVAINVSNSGKLGIPVSYGPRTIREFYAVASQHVIGSTIQIAVWSLGGTMFVTVTTVAPLLSQEHALQVVSTFERLVLRACEPGDFDLRDLRSA